MATETYTETGSTAVPWYFEEPYMTERSRALLREYVGLKDAEIEPHLHAFRNKAWAVRPYPCIGLWSFLSSTFTCATFPDLDLESIVLQRLKEGASFLDLGCAMAQTMRFLAWRGAPTDRMVMADVEPNFFAASYELFCDSNRLRSKFVQSNILESSPQLLQDYRGVFDIIVAGDFLHVFTRADQVLITRRMIELSRPTAGSLIIGKQVGRRAEPDEYVNSNWREGHSVMFQPGPAGLRRVWEEAMQLTGTSWDVRIEAEEIGTGPWQPREAFESLGGKALGIKFLLTRK